MNFISLSFFVFIIIVFCLYYLIPQKYQWILLLIASLVFYGWTNLYYLIFLLSSIIIVYLLTIFMGKINYSQSIIFEGELSKEERKIIRLKNQKKKKWLCTIGVILNIGIVVVFKYFNFIGETTIAIFNKFGFESTFNSLDIILPIGLSFYIFQSVGYCIDVYRETIIPQKNIFKYALFVAYFPQVLQGPIGRYETLAPQLYSEHKIDSKQIYFGFQRIVLGFFKKIAIADVLGVIVNAVFNNYERTPGIICFFALILYSIQLYADFSGFMDIALGVSSLFGIKLDENFDSPYMSKSIAEFWRRWHITLGTWFKDYLYYPLMRSKLFSKMFKMKNKRLSSTIITCLSLFIVWLCIGLWHGASWNYVLYGLYYGVIIIFSMLLQPIYKLVRQKLHINAENRFYKMYQIIRTYVIVVFGYILFRSPDLDFAANYLMQMFSLNSYENFMFNMSFLSTACYLTWNTIIEMIFVCAIWYIVNMQNGKWEKSLQDNLDLTLDIKISSYINIAVMIISILLAFVMINSIGGRTIGFIYFEF